MWMKNSWQSVQGAEGCGWMFSPMPSHMLLVKSPRMQPAGPFLNPSPCIRILYTQAWWLNQRQVAYCGTQLLPEGWVEPNFGKAHVLGPRTQGQMCTWTTQAQACTNTLSSGPQTSPHTTATQPGPLASALTPRKVVILIEAIMVSTMTPPPFPLPFTRPSHIC